MPLAFPSQSHGIVAFGFFNIEIEMLLLESLFFFADQFCQAVVDLGKPAGGLGASETNLVRVPGWRIRDTFAIGNLQGAIQGTDLSGFIGETYRLFPFPKEPEAFRQSPTGSQNRDVAQSLIERHGEGLQISLRYDPVERTVAIEEFVFQKDAFAALVGYVDRGGYPRWKDDIRPRYVHDMMESLSKSQLFAVG